MTMDSEEQGAPVEGAVSSCVVNLGRRRFVAAAAATAATVIAGAGLSGLLGKPGNAGAAAEVTEKGTQEKALLPAPTAGESALLRMQRELQRAMEKPVDQRRWIMVIDLKKCVGCYACTIACKAENVLPPGVVYRPVLEEEIGEYPHVSARFTPRPCMQCANPPCTKVCPVSATYKRKDGIVAINYEQCIGCRACLTACPYRARTFDFGDYYTSGTPALQKYEKVPSPEYGGSRVRVEGESPIGNARKCQFCLHRLDAGMLPACVTTCIGTATYFGDANDSHSLVTELKGSNRVIRLKEEVGTDPKVYYLV